jgi:hypothetical protein
MPCTSDGSMEASRRAASTAWVASLSSERPEAFENSVAPIPVIATFPAKV